VTDPEPRNKWPYVYTRAPLWVCPKCHGVRGVILRLRFEPYLDMMPMFHICQTCGHIHQVGVGDVGPFVKGDEK